MLNLIKTEVREACQSLSLLKGLRSDMVEKINNTLLNNCSVVNDRYVLSIEDDNGIDKAITNWLDSIFGLSIAI